jgi:type IX secretion system PorP/SprF family membrane protein
MIHRIFCSIIFISVFAVANAQQLPHLSAITESRHFWNPAMTGLGSDVMIDGFARQQWVGFEGSPFSSFAALQVPFQKMNMGAGGNLYMDRVGPLTKAGANFNYSYHLKESFGDNSLLSLGLNAGIHQYNLNTSSFIVNNENDALLGGTENSGFFPTVGFGMYYLSNTREYREENATFFGFSVIQGFASNVLIREWNQQRTSHYFFDFGTRLYSFNYYVEPSISVNYVSPELMNILINGKLEFRDKFWAGMGYSTINDLCFQGGLIIDEPNGRYTKLKVGMMANIGLSSDLVRLGPGFELFVRYQYESR